MNQHYWLRTEKMSRHPNFAERGKTIFVMRALRSDGQPFLAWTPEDTESPEIALRETLNGMLNDPALPFIANADLTTRKKYCGTYKGEPDWVEESAPHPGEDL